MRPGLVRGWAANLKLSVVPDKRALRRAPIRDPYRVIWRSWLAGYLKGRKIVAGLATDFCVA